MRSVGIGLALSACLAVLGYNPVSASALITSDPASYLVKMTTSVTIPPSGPRCTQLRVWHAIPTWRNWSQAQKPYGITGLKNTQSYVSQAGTAAVIEPEPEDPSQSTHALWTINRGLLPGKHYRFVTEFLVTSSARKLDRSKASNNWTHFRQEAQKKRVKIRQVPPQVRALAVQLFTGKNPIETVIDYSEWINKNIKYDACATTNGDDTALTLATRTGHCGHIMSLFRDLCAAQGIAARPVLGLNLHYPDPDRAGYETNRPDMINSHIWAEILVPNTGWVEIDPGAGRDCLQIPNAYVQNNRAFQNYAVWVTERGRQPRSPEWHDTGSSMVNEYGIDHRNFFSKTSLSK